MARGASISFLRGSRGNKGPEGRPKAPGSELSGSPSLWHQGRGKLSSALSPGVSQLGFQSLWTCQDPALSLGLSLPLQSLGSPNPLPSCRALRPLAWAASHPAVLVPAAAAGTAWVPWSLGTVAAAGGQ